MNVITNGSLLDDLNKFLGMLHRQDDRAVVLSLASFIEETLGQLLLAYFRDCRQTRELIEGFNAPLGTLSARIKASYAFGLVNEVQFKDMELLRKTRNAFAHDWQGVSLERNDIKSMLGQMSQYTLSPDDRKGSTPRDQLIDTITTISIEMNIFYSQLISGKTKKAPLMSFRLTALRPDDQRPEIVEAA